MPTPPNVHYTTLANTIPAWLKRSPPALHRQLRNWQQAPAWLADAIARQPDVARAWAEEHARHREHQADVQKLFAHLPDLQSYARAALSDALNARFEPAQPIDVDHTYLIDARLIDTSNAIDGRQAVNRATRSLLQCAMHNFDAQAAGEHGMDAPKALLKRSVIVDHRRFMGTVPITNALDISAEAFAELCRNLDIGGGYHALVHAIYYPAATAERSADEVALEVYQTLGKAEVSAWRQSLHFARLKGDIDQGFYDAALATPVDQAPAADAPLTFSTLSLWEAELTGVILITWQGNGQLTHALYVAQDEQTPLKAFPSIGALENELSDRLRANIAYLDAHIPEGDKAAVQSRLADRLTPIQWSSRGLLERLPDTQASLNPVMRPFTHAFQGMMALQKVERHERDALYHAIPTEIVDRRSAQMHRELIFGRALTGLNIAGFFVPGLGQLMLAVCVTQLAFEVYDGIEAWHNDERDTAFNYLVDVIENVALMAAFAAAHKALKGAKGEPSEDAYPERLAVETPSFIEELQDVEMPDGRIRLWKSDLRPHHSDQPLPAGLETDERGLRMHQGKQWLVIEGQQYQVERTPATDQYRLRHPTAPHRYSPLLAHNGSGAWLLPGDRPRHWAGSRLLRRLGHLSAHFDEATLQRILQISATEQSTLRRVLAQNLRLPALLEDTLQRFKLDQSVRQTPGTTALPALFTQAYERLQPPLTLHGELIQRVYPALPGLVIEELLGNANAQELQALASGKVPLRLAEEIRVYQQQVRLARAYEGLHLAGVQSWDSDRLILQTLTQLPGWPVETKLKLLQRRFWPDQHHAIGPQDTRPYITLTHAHAGYLVTDTSQPGATVPIHPDIYDALHQALPQAMAQLGATDGKALQQLMQQSPLLPRQALRRALGMQPVRPGYRSPMRLADGRLGYPLSSGDDQAQGSTRQHLLATLRATGIPERTGRPAEQLLSSIASNGRNRLQILEYLTTLLDERNELQSRLDDWSEAISPASDQAARAYDALRESIMQHWYDTALQDDASRSAELSVQGVPLTDIPMTLPGFFYQRIHNLHLLDLPSGPLAGWGQSERLMQRLFRLMPQLESLEISRPYNPRATPSLLQASVSSIPTALPNLRRLALTNQNIALTGSHLTELAGLAQLSHLDLSGNRLQQSGDRPSFHLFSLDYLGLNRMQLSRWPLGIGSDALARIGHLSLQENNLTSLPSFLINETQTLVRPPVISLQGNNINETHLQRLLLSEHPATAQVALDQTPALDQRLARIRNERQQLREAIDGWAQASSSSQPLTQATLADRQRIATAINEFWERQERGQQYLRLVLEEVALENFPRRLPAFFGERVTSVVLTRLRGDASQLDQLLGRFPNVTRLVIDAHQGANGSLATALLRLPRLVHLEVRNMGLEVDQAMLDTLAQLQHLTSLDLSGNRIGNITQAPASLAANLTSLGLTNMNLQAWPAWCNDLLPLELLDLSANSITELPEHILSNLNNALPISSISLFDNPLPMETILRVRAFSDSQRSYSFALDIPDNLLLASSSSEGSLDHPHFPMLSDDTPRMADWMPGNAAQNEALQACWEQLEGSDLLRLVGRLHNAAPFVDLTTRASFTERVRLMLVAAVANPEERPLLESIAAAALPDPETGSQTCHDGALQEFNNIELYLLSKRVLIDAGDTLQTLRRRLLQLFRMGQLEKLASTRTGSGDLVSVRLAYRRELAKELDLPIADSMRFRGAANLARGELSSVLEHVRQSEHGDAFIDYLLANADWTARLRAENAPRFDEVEARFRQRVLDLASADHPLQVELDLQQGLLADKAQEEQQLLRELTITFVNNDD